MALTQPINMRQIAQLARLELTAEEDLAFTEQIDQVLRYMDVLGELKLEGVEPLFQPHDLPTAFRVDVAHPFGVDSNGQPKTLASAPDVQDSGFKVPQIV
ncbi:MAG: Asp-tRNA(Asn)/Glu-tRNA(Gln) amidotransferase subunit GatC [Oligoflexia bacterium]|nr:Asp-tRNA(Asn)/Glu-tRNA(Gln) amidotransferase subunit GatC [Oligoflexia bacterium]